MSNPQRCPVCGDNVSDDEEAKTLREFLRAQRIFFAFAKTYRRFAPSPNWENREWWLELPHQELRDGTEFWGARYQAPNPKLACIIAAQELVRVDPELEKEAKAFE